MRPLPLVLALLTSCVAPACSDGRGPRGDAGAGTGGNFADAPSVATLGRPPIVLIVFDALHAGHVGHLGYERDTTPHLDAIAAGAVSFSSAFAPAPYTLASIPSLLTGRRPDTHGVTSSGARLGDEETTLAEICARSGYRTLAAVGNLNGSERTGNSQGFETFRELFRDPEFSGSRSDAVLGAGLRYATANMFVDFMSEELARSDPAQPLFLYLHILEPHAPYVMPDEYRELWLDPSYDGPFASGATQPFMDSLSGKLTVTERDKQAGRALYDGNLRWADHNLGLLRAQLETAGLWDEALVIITSDHGEAFWQHGRWGHSDHLYDEQLRVPLVIKLPADRGLRGVVRDDLVSLLDVTPSICEWLDVAPGMLPLDGFSLAALAEDASWKPSGRELFLRTCWGIANLGLRTASTKTIVERGPKRGDKPWGHVVRTRHFDLAADGDELNDLYAQRQAPADADAARLLEWGQEAIRNRNERGTGMTPGEVSLLRGLGYVDVPPAHEAQADDER